MKPFFAVLKKELKSYIDHPMAYVLAVVFLVINNFLFFRTSFSQDIASLRAMFNLLPWVLLFFISALTMRAWAEEQRENTLSVLLSYPVRVWQILMGKFAATSLFIIGVLSITLLIPASLSSFGNFDGGVLVSQYVGAALMILAMVAIGQWASTLTKNQVVAFIISIAALFVFFFVGLDFVVLALPYPLNQVAQQLGMLSHFNAMTRGVLDLRDVLYFLTVSFVFLALSYAWLTKMKIVRSSKEWRVLQTSIAVIIAIAVVINLFGQGITLRADLTEQDLYSLSSATKSTLRNLDDTVKITLYRSQKLPTQIELVSRDVQDILRDYQKFGGNNVDIAIRYPDQDEEAKSAAESNGIPAVRFNVVRQDEFTLQEGYLGLVIQFLDKKETLPFIRSIDDLEYRLTRAILALQNDTKPRLGYLSDFGGKPLSEWTAFSDALRESYIIEQVTLASDGEEEAVVAPQIADVDLLVIAAPTQKYSDAALTAVKDYINKGGHILWLVSGTKVDQASLSATANDTGLASLLKEQGVVLNQDLVADLASHETVNFSAGVFSYLLPYPFWVRAGVLPHVIAGNIAQVVLPWSSSLTIEDRETISPLVSTTENAVHQTSGFNLSPDNLESLVSLEKRQFLMGAAVESVPAGDGQEDGRWVVFSNTGLLENGMLQQNPANIALVLNALDWLAQNDALIAIRTKSSQPPVLVWESKGTQSVVKWVNLLAPPIAVVLFGALWVYRRRKKSKQAA